MEPDERAEPKRHAAARQTNSSWAVDGRRSTQDLFAVPGIEEARMTPWTGLQVSNLRARNLRNLLIIIDLVGAAGVGLKRSVEN